MYTEVYDAMPRTRRAAMLTAVYAAALGAALMLAPHTLFGLVFDRSEASRGFVRLGGGLLALFGAYYWGAARVVVAGSDAVRGNLQGFFAATVWGRAGLVVLCAYLRVSGQIGPGAWLLAAMNALGALSMWRALRADMCEVELEVGDQQL